MQLTRKRRQFISKYIQNGLNGTRAVLDCGITDNYASARTLAWRMLTRVDVRSEVEQELKASKISADEVLEELSKLARAVIPDDKISEAGKLKALELSGKAHKLFTEKVETLTTEGDSAIHLKSILSEQISLIADDDAIPQSEAEYRLQSRLADRSRKSYSEKYDPQLHPELWPGGCLIPKNIQQIEGEQ